jgi:hypothetical protein
MAKGQPYHADTNYHYFKSASGIFSRYSLRRYLAWHNEW